MDARQGLEQHVLIIIPGRNLERTHQEIPYPVFPFAFIAA